jgi:FixJ family two-component response regulator
MDRPDEISDLVCVIDDDDDVRGSLDSLLRASGFSVRSFASPEEFLACTDADQAACLLLDIRLKDADGLDFQQELADNAIPAPVILITGHGDIPMTVRGMKAGAVNFLAKPIDEDALLRSVQEAVAIDRERRAAMRVGENIRACFETLSQRECEVMALVTAGLMNKQVAGRLCLSEITVKIHRGHVMRKMQAQSLADLVRMAEELGVRDTSATRYHSAG